LILLLSILFMASLGSAAFTLKYNLQGWNLIRAFDPPVLADTNNDGKLDSFFLAGLNITTTGQGIVLRIDSATGNIIWRRDYFDVDASQELNPIEIYDVTGDGCPDVFCHFGASNVGYEVGFICLNGLTGETVWWNLDNVIRPAWHHFVILADKNTNVPYIFFNSHPYVDGGPFYMRKLNAVTGQEIASLASGGTCNGGVSAANIDNSADGSVELVIGPHSTGIEVYDFNLNLLWKITTPSLTSTQCVKLVDINGDGILDLVSGRQSTTTHAGLNVIDGATHQAMSGYYVDDYSAINSAWAASSHEDPGMMDIDGDGIYEICIGDYSTTYAQVFKISNPPQLVKTLTVLGMGEGNGQFMDIVGDSRPELLTNSHYIYDTETWTRVAGTPGINCFGGSLGDIDGDGLFELYGQNNGGIAAYDTDKTAKDGINPGTSHWGYRRVMGEIQYQEAPGSWWYSWAQWQQDHSPCNEGTTKCMDGTIWTCQSGVWVDTGLPCETTPGFEVLVFFVAFLAIVMIMRKKQRK